MIRDQKHLVNELISINRNVTKELRRKGFVPALRNSDGSVSVGNFIIKKNKNGSFFVINRDGDNLVDNINLPQSAAILANNLALGKLTETEIIDMDIIYGACMFDEEIYKQKYLKYKDKDYRQAELMNIKYQVAKQKKEFYKNKILSGYNKLIKLT